MTRTRNHLQDLLTTAAPGRASRLPRVRGLSWKEGGRGELVVGPARAELRIEPGDRLRATLALEDAFARRNPLAEAAGWPGNARVAARPGGLSLLADGWIDDERAAAASLREIRRAVAEAARSTVRSRLSPCSGKPPLALLALVAALRARGERLVELDGGFELQPRVAGHPVPVRALANGRGLLIARSLARATTGQGQHDRRPLEHLALRLNARLRFARLVERDGRLQAETHLSAELVELHRVLAGARAVALAAEHAEAHLEVFARDPRAARAYAEVFLPETPHQGVIR